MEKVLEPIDVSDPSTIESWFERFSLYVTTNDKITTTNKVAFLLTLMGKDAYNLLKDLAFPTLPKDLKVNDIEEYLVNHMRPRNYEVHERALFNSLIRRSNQPIKDFILSLQKQAMKCNFGSELTTHLRDRLVAGINDDNIKRKMLSDARLTFESAKGIAIAHTSIDSAVRAEHDDKPVLAAFHKKRVNHVSSAAKSTFSPSNRSGNRISNFSKDSKGFCYSCGSKDHMRNACKFRNATCHTCKKLGHIQRVCRSKSNTGSGMTHLVSDSNAGDSNADFCLSISDAKHIKRSCEVSDSEGSRQVEFIFDTGSPHSFICIDDVQPFKVKIVPTSETVKGITGHKLDLYGEVHLRVNGVDTRLLVCDQLNILGVQEIMSMHPEIGETLFHGFVSGDSSISNQIELASNCKGGIDIAPVHIDHDNREPKFFKSRPIPFGLREPVMKILDKWVADGIAVKVESSRWATPIVTPLKSNGQPRVCGDYRVTVNPILRHHAPTTPEPEDLFAKLNNAAVFSKVDLENAFLQIPLDVESQELTTLITPFGLYSMRFLPFGWHVSSSVFQAVMDDIIKDLPNVVSYQDDLLVYASDEKEHDVALARLLERLIKYNVRINKGKSVFRMKEITYLGYMISSKGIQPDPEKFNPILSAADPKTQHELHSILGCLQYYSRFSPDFARIAAGLFDLCRKGSEFNWEKHHSEALRHLKEEIFSKKLKPFSMVAKTTRLICDASEHAIGGMIEQEGSPVICVSRKLSASEVGYSQTQKEALAIHWCVKRLHKFLCGHHFTIVTDHRSLIHIFDPRGSISKGTSNMLQRWSWRLSSYDYDVEFQRGVSIPQADFLSRFAKSDDSSSTNVLFTQPLPIGAASISRETKRCYGPILAAIRRGWSAKAKRQFRQFYVNREELSVTIEGHLAFRELIVIPPCLRRQMMQHLHIGHVGVEKMRSLARLLCWWPTINSDIQNFSKQCIDCITKVGSSPSNWSAWPATYEKNQRLHMDYAGPFLSRYYCLVIIDSYSKWPEVFLTEKADSSFTERCLRSYFSREGTPQTIVSDNGTHFTERNLNQWLSSLNIIHLFSAPRHPKSNGLAENFIKTLKQAISSELKGMRECRELERFILNFLFQYRNAEHSTTRQRPSVLFRGHALKSNVIGRQKVMFQRGNDLRYRHGVILKNLGKKWPPSRIRKTAPSTVVILNSCGSSTMQRPKPMPRTCRRAQVHYNRPVHLRSQLRLKSCIRQKSRTLRLL